MVDENIDSCEALKIIDGISEKRLQRRNIARMKFMAIDNDSDLERRISIYERGKQLVDPSRLVIDQTCYVCQHQYLATGGQNLYNICDICLDYWDEQPLDSRK